MTYNILYEWDYYFFYKLNIVPFFFAQEILIPVVNHGLGLKAFFFRIKSIFLLLLSCLGYVALNGQMSVRDKMERMRKIQHQSLPGWKDENYKKKHFRIASIQSVFEFEAFRIRS